MKDDHFSSPRVSPAANTESDDLSSPAELGSKAYITQRLGAALRHLDVSEDTCQRILRTNSLSIEGQQISLHTLPEGLQAFASTVALVAELAMLDGQREDSLRFALRTNTRLCLAQGCSISRSEDGMMFLLRPLELLQYDDTALAQMLQSTARLVLSLGQEFRAECAALQAQAGPGQT